MAGNRYVVEVLCSGMGYVKSNRGGDTLKAAQDSEDALLKDDSAWVNPAAPRQTRVRDVQLGTTHTRVH